MQLSFDILKSLEHRYGDSFYLVDLDAFEANYRELLDAFRSLYPKTQIAYSYKTNYTPELCKRVDQWGGYAEVVSRMEYELARRIGVAGTNIVFNGPCKDADDLETAWRLGSTVNLDQPYQVSILERVGRAHSDRNMSVGVRVNFHLENNEPSRFGFDADSDELATVVRRIRAVPNADLVGLHCHVWTRSRSLEVYRHIAQRMLQLADSCFPASRPRFLDIGGGFFSKMKPALRDQFDIEIPSYEDYAGVIASRFADRYPHGDGPELILEPGMAITADIMSFVARVIDVHVVGSRRLALVSGSFHNTRPTAVSQRNLPMSVFAGRRSEPRLDGPTDLVGYTCMEGDVLHHGFEGALSPGDFVVFDNVGAYTNVLKPPFIRECPPILGWDSRIQEFKVLKRCERLDDVFATYVL